MSFVLANVSFHSTKIGKFMVWFSFRSIVFVPGLTNANYIRLLTSAFLLLLRTTMGAGASVSKEEVQGLPQYTIMGGDAKFDELKGEDGKVALDKVEDPYLLYGGSYAGDAKDAPDFKYLTFAEVPKFTDKHKSLMAKTLTPELFAKLKDVKSSKVPTVHFANLQTPLSGQVYELLSSCRAS